MPHTDTYEFRKVTLDDLPLLATWQAEPHVAEWWDADDPDVPADLDDPRVARWIVSLHGTPFAYMQDYTVHGWPDHHFAHLPPGSRGIDQYIGMPEMTGQGHGPAFIRSRLQALFTEGAPKIATDPHPDNTRAIAAYRKAGFAPSGPATATRWGLILPMVAARDDGRGNG